MPFELTLLPVMFCLALGTFVGFMFFLGSDRPAVATLIGLVVFATLSLMFGYGEHQRDEKVQRLQAQVREKYRVEFYDGQSILAADRSSIDVIGYVDGEQRGCTLRFKGTDPLVFCTAGVEADRAS